MRFSNFMNKALMGKRIMHSARALFLTFLALEKSKRNCTFHENCAAAEKLCRSSATAAELIYSGTEDYATADLRQGREKITSGAKNSNNS